MAELKAIWIKRVRRGKMDPVSSAELRAGHGIVGNANVGGRRQVTTIEREVWDQHMTAHGASLDPRLVPDGACDGSAMASRESC